MGETRRAERSSALGSRLGGLPHKDQLEEEEEKGGDDRPDDKCPGRHVLLGRLMVLCAGGWGKTGEEDSEVRDGYRVPPPSRPLESSAESGTRAQPLRYMWHVAVAPIAENEGDRGESSGKGCHWQWSRLTRSFLEGICSSSLALPSALYLGVAVCALVELGHGPVLQLRVLRVARHEEHKQRDGKRGPRHLQRQRTRCEQGCFGRRRRAKGASAGGCAEEGAAQRCVCREWEIEREKRKERKKKEKERRRERRRFRFVPHVEVVDLRSPPPFPLPLSMHADAAVAVTEIVGIRCWIALLRTPQREGREGEKERERVDHQRPPDFSAPILSRRFLSLSLSLSLLLSSAL